MAIKKGKIINLNLVIKTVWGLYLVENMVPPVEFELFSPVVSLI
jgi:hypothetical protein